MTIGTGATHGAVALVTGAARRIGAAIATDLAARGFAVAIHANRSITQAEALARSIAESGGRAAAFRADLRDPAALEGLVAEAAATLGPVRLLVNNASVFQPDGIGTLTVERFDENHAVHVRAPVFLAQAFADRLPRTSGGLIVNIVDQRVLKPTPQFLSYAISKAALWSATRMLAQGLAPRIRVNAIGPGPTLPNERQTADDFARQAAAVLLGRGPDLGDFGRTIAYLWDTPSITGQLITIDGGQHLAWETPDIVGMTE